MRSDEARLRECCERAQVALPEQLIAYNIKASGVHAHELLDVGRGRTFAIGERVTGAAVGGVGIVFRHPPGTAEPAAWVIDEERNRDLPASTA